MEGICERIEALLRERGISGSRMSADLGMSRSFMTELRKGRAKGVKMCIRDSASTFRPVQ